MNEFLFNVITNKKINTHSSLIRMPVSYRQVELVAQGVGLALCLTCDIFTI